VDTMSTGSGAGDSGSMKVQSFSTIMEVMLWLLSVKNEDPKGMHRVLRCEGQGWGQEGALPCGRKEFVYSGVLLVAADCC